jgi:hypothetical protein
MLRAFAGIVTLRDAPEKSAIQNRTTAKSVFGEPIQVGG